MGNRQPSIPPHVDISKSVDISLPNGSQEEKDLLLAYAFKLRSEYDYDLYKVLKKSGQILDIIHFNHSVDRKIISDRFYELCRDNYIKKYGEDEFNKFEKIMNINKLTSKT